MSDDQQFKSSDFTLGLQKKVFGKLANKRLVKRLLDDNQAKLLDNLHKSIKMFTEEGKSNSWNVPNNSEKAIKNLIKVMVKLSLLVMNNQFKPEEKLLVGIFQQNLRSTFMTLVSFEEVEYSYDRKFLIELFEKHRTTLKELADKHLSDKSNDRIDNFMDVLTNPNYLDFLFSALKSTTNPQINDEIIALRSEIMTGFKGLIETFHM